MIDIPEDYLLFLQDMFPYLEIYLVTDYLPKLVERIEYVIKQDIYVAPDKTSPQQSARSCCDRALLLDYKAELFLINLYNNLSNTYLLMKKTKEAAEMLHTALTIRQEYSHLGLAESHDMLQQLMNLTNMLILSKNAEMAKQVLSAYESLVLEHEGTQTLDNGICQMMYGAIALSEGNAKEAELHALFQKPAPHCSFQNSLSDKKNSTTTG